MRNPISVIASLHKDDNENPPPQYRSRKQNMKDDCRRPDKLALRTAPGIGIDFSRAWTFDTTSGAYDWAVANGYFTLSKPHHQTSEFIGRFSGGDIHYHYEAGLRSEGL